MLIVQLILILASDQCDQVTICHCISLYINTIIIMDYTGQYNTIIKLWLFCHHNVYIVISYTWFIGIVFIETIMLGPGGKQIKLFIVQINSDKHQLFRKCKNQISNLMWVSSHKFSRCDRWPVFKIDGFCYTEIVGWVIKMGLVLVFQFSFEQLYCVILLLVACLQVPWVGDLFMVQATPHWWAAASWSYNQ